MPFDEAIKYLAGAYLVFGVLLFSYLGIMAAKVTRLRQDVASLNELMEDAER